MRALSIALFVLLTASSRAAEQQYPIQFDRPMKVGDRFGIKSSASRTVDGLATPDRHEPKTMQERSTVALDGACEVLAVNADGGIAKVKIDVDKATLTLPTGAADELEPGTVLLVAIEKGRKFITRERVPLAA